MKRNEIYNRNFKSSNFNYLLTLKYIKTPADFIYNQFVLELVQFKHIKITGSEEFF